MSNTRRPTTARKVTPKDKAKQQDALDSGVRFKLDEDGEWFYLRPADVTPILAREVRNVTGRSFMRLMALVIEDPDVDAVYISLPNTLHREWSVKALEAGKHVICEKPFSRRVEDVEAAFDAAERAGRHLTEAFMYRHNPQTHKLAELVRDGARSTNWYERMMRRSTARKDSVAVS